MRRRWHVEARVPKKMRPKYLEIVELIDAICQTHLGEEYRDLSRELAAKLSRKRPSPLERGSAENWAGAIVYTVGRINFLFDPDQDPHLGAEELCQLMGVKQSTISSKASKIMDIFGMHQFHPDWTRPSLVDRNPLAWMISVNGLIVDARYAPREIQEEAFRLGLIPRIPDSRPGSDEES
jgi:hypothetical protein